MIKSTSFQATFFHEISCSNLFFLLFFKEVYHSVHSEGAENISPDAARTAVFPLLAQSFHLELAAIYHHFRPRDNHAIDSTEGPSNLLTGYL